MPKISDIRAQSKNKNRMSVYVGGKYAFSLTTRQLLEAGLKIGQALKPGELLDFKTESQYGKLLDQALKWLALRPHSEHEVDEYLRRKSKDKRLNERIKNHLIELGGIDDRAFAGAWIRTRKLLKPISSYRIKRELIAKKVPAEIIDETINSEELDDFDAACELIRRKRHQTRYKDKRKLKQFLARQGFVWDVIKRAIESVED